MNYKTISVLFSSCVLFGTCGLCFGAATEQIGPDTEHPTVSQQDWPKGIVEIPRHSSRVYSIWVNGNENFYFKATVEEINELLGLFAKARMRDHIVRIQAGQEKARTIGGEDIEYNVRLQIVAGIVLFAVREEQRDDLPLEPELTILTGDEQGALVNQLKWPENVIVESEIPGVTINSHRAKPKRDYYFGRLEFEDGSPPVGFVRGVDSRITLWEQKEKEGINIASVNNKGYFTTLLSERELANLKKGTAWLTVTIGNFLVEASKTDQRFPVKMLPRDKEKARAVRVKKPEYYYGRILFEDASPPILDPAPWPGAEIMVVFPYTGPAIFDSDGYFKVYFTKDQYEKAKAQKARRNIYVPSYHRKGTSTAASVFPVNLLSQDKAKAGVVKIPRPEPPRKELSTAESKIGQPIPGFDKIGFEGFQTDQIKGKRLLVCFWDIDQRPSRQCLLELQKQKQSLLDKGIIALAVHSGTKREKEVRQWLAKENISLTVGMIEGDPYDTLLAWGARGTPWLILTDEQHITLKAGFNVDILEQLTAR